MLQELAEAQEIFLKVLETVALLSSTPTVEGLWGQNRRPVPPELLEAKREYKQAAARIRNLNQNIRVSLHSSFTPRVLLDEVHHIYRKT